MATTRGVVRVATAGSVDDGKSTLIGRLLFDCKALMADQLDHIKEASLRRGFARTELALLTDGLRAEREQGITIDVSWRYFSTQRRRFVLADTPGHVQYTRNMVTGASTADVSVVLVDAERGVADQTRRHLYITALLGVPRVIVAVNKMDRVGFDRVRFHALAAEVQQIFAAGGGTGRLEAVPVSALHGDNIVEPSDKTPWYQGSSLLTLLEQGGGGAAHDGPGRFPVQWVIRPQEERHHHYRGLAGRVAAGTIRVGERVVVLPGGQHSVIKAIDVAEDARALAAAGDSIVLHLRDDVDAARGDLVAAADDAPTPSTELTVDVCWLSTRPLLRGARLTLKHTTRRVRAIVDEIVSRTDVTSGAPEPSERLEVNDLGRLRLTLAEPILAEPYSRSRSLGAAILIDDVSTDTVGACMIRGTSDQRHFNCVASAERTES
jgi:sulfate adenylyltransferase subunit 1